MKTYEINYTFLGGKSKPFTCKNEGVLSEAMDPESGRDCSSAKCWLEILKLCKSVEGIRNWWNERNKLTLQDPTYSIKPEEIIQLFKRLKNKLWHKEKTTAEKLELLNKLIDYFSLPQLLELGFTAELLLVSPEALSQLISTIRNIILKDSTFVWSKNKKLLEKQGFSIHVMLLLCINEYEKIKKCLASIEDKQQFLYDIFKKDISKKYNSLTNDKDKASFREILKIIKPVDIHDNIYEDIGIKLDVGTKTEE